MLNQKSKSNEIGATSYMKKLAAKMSDSDKKIAKFKRDNGKLQEDIEKEEQLEQEKQEESPTIKRFN
jgi:hypothetical protein